MNRKEAPKRILPEHIDFIDPEKEVLNNGMPVYLLDGGSQEVCRIEFYFKAGSAYQEKPLQASFTNHMINAGTSTMTADQLASKMDYFGAYLKTEVTRDFFKVTLFTMNRFLGEVLAIVADMLKDPIFPEGEFEILRKNKYEKFKVNGQKVKTLARREFARRLFAGHPYGVIASDESYRQIEPDDCRRYYGQLIHPENCEIFVSGMVDKSTIDKLNDALGGWSCAGAQQPHKVDQVPSSQRAKYTVTKKDAVQSAIRMGRSVVDRRHEDHHALRILNTVFGGYFGSRLMSNIREDKGYTYGIGSTINTEQFASYWILVTEVGAQYTEDTIEEIHKEMDRLRNENIEDHELSLVRNYITGTLLKGSDGPFAMADRFKALYFHGLDYSHYDDFLHTVKEISADDLKKTAQKYMDPADFLTVMARPELDV